MKQTLKSKLIFVGILVLSGLVGVGATRQTAKPKLREITFEAHKYAYTPARLKVNVGDTLKITLRTRDVTHGFYLEGFDFNAYVRPQTRGFFVQQRDAEDSEDGEDSFEEVQTYTLVVDKIGKFRYRCSVTCGPMHPFMQGELVVGPNYPYTTAISLSIGLMLGALLYFFQTERNAEEKGKENLAEGQISSKGEVEAPSSQEEEKASDGDCTEPTKTEVESRKDKESDV
jgi:plastocyanin